MTYLARKHRVAAVTTILLAVIALATPATGNERSAQLITQAGEQWSRQDTSGTEATLLKAINADLKDPKARRALGTLYLTQNQNRKAIEQFQEGSMLQPDNAHFFIGLAIAYLHQSAYSAAHVMANRALILQPDLEQAKKLQQYIGVKQEVLERAEEGGVDNTAHNPGH